MRPPRLRTQIFPYSLAVTLIALSSVTVYAVSAIRELHERQTGEVLLDKARLVERLVQPRLADEPAALEAFVRELGGSVRTRITVIHPGGRVLADSDQAPEAMADHSDRPEIRAALARGVGQALRYSPTLGRDMLYVAVRLPEALPNAEAGPSPDAVIRTALPLTTLAETLRDTLRHVALVGLFAGLLAAALGLLVARAFTRPIEDLTQGALTFAEGTLSHRITGGGSREVSDLASAMNRMAEQLGERLATIHHQRDELEAVLEGMVEGVLVVDASLHVLRVNSAGLGLLGLTAEQVTGRTLQEVLRHPELDRLVADIVAAGAPREGELLLRDGADERTLEVHGTSLPNTGDVRQGVVLVLHDVTRTRRLERVRRDFVANVSHELRTPVTAIKGSVETLQDHARHDPEATERFLGIVQAQADRLEALLEDLLALSRVEQDPRGVVPSEVASLRALAEEALATCEAAAREKGVTLALTAGPDVVAPVNRTLLVQALVNLLDNAVKYSDAGTLTTLTLEARGGEAWLHVTDQGPGISAEHLPRIFERFYRVDKGRSRQLGGTGLGLAIVKHIALAHGGRVEVQSTPGKGSRFTLVLAIRPVPPS